MDLQGKRVIITGASSGIGEELALQLAKERARLTLAARRVDRLEKVAEACRRLGAEVLLVATDVAEESQCRALVEKSVAQFGGLDVLIVNAGISMYARFEEITDLTIFERLMRVNYFGAVWCTYHALPHLKTSRGAVLAVSSLAGKMGLPTRTAYSASKHAMQGFFDSLRTEVQGRVQVTVVCPGPVISEIRDRAVTADGALGKSVLDESKSMSTEECARLTLAALREGRREEIMTLAGKLGVRLRPFAPAIVDYGAKRRLSQP